MAILECKGDSLGAAAVDKCLLSRLDIIICFGFFVLRSIGDVLENASVFAKIFTISSSIVSSIWVYVRSFLHSGEIWDLSGGQKRSDHAEHVSRTKGQFDRFLINYDTPVWQAIEKKEATKPFVVYQWLLGAIIFVFLEEKGNLLKFSLKFNAILIVSFGANPSSKTNLFICFNFLKLKRNG